MTAIELRGLAKEYGVVRALSDVSLDVPEATVGRIAGPNGAGKSTLLRVAAGLTRPTSGTVRLLGHDPFHSRGVAVRGEVGWLGAGAGLYGDLTVDENLRFAARLSSTDPERVDWAVDRFGLAPVRGRRVRLLSQGFRRRAGLARAFLPGPRLLLLDEPWNGLDAESGRRLTKLLGEHRGAGGTALVVAHGEIPGGEVVDRQIHLERGTVLRVDEGPP